MDDIVKQKRYQESVNEAKIAHSKGGYVEVGKWYLLNYGKWKDTIKVVNIDAKGMKVYNPNDNWRYTIPMTMIKKKKIGGYMTPIDESINEVEKWKNIGIDVRDIYDYMVSLKKTNPSKFKKDMKNKALKDIWNRYSKGGEMYKESDLGLTLKKGKTVKVTHKKSGKELVIIDKPNVRKEYEKIGFYAEGNVSEVLTRGGAIELQGQAKYLAQGLKDMTKSYKKKDWAQMEEEVDYIVTKAKMMGDIVKQKRYQESVNESGIMYRAGVKKYGLEGMKKIQSAAGKGLGHAEIGKIKDKYDKKRKKSESVDEGSMEKNFKWAKGKELKAIEMMIDMEAEGISAVVKNYKKNPKAFKQFVKDISRMKGMDESVEPKGNMAKIFKIVKDKQHAKIGGMLVDMFSASALVKIFDAVNDSNKEKLNKMNMKKLSYVLGKAFKDKVVV